MRVQDLQLLAAVAQILVAAAALTAAFLPYVVKWCRRPRLGIAISSASRGDCHKIAYEWVGVDRGGEVRRKRVGDAYFVRLRVNNRGGPARDVEVFLAKVVRRDEGHVRSFTNYLPMNLKWSHIDPPEWESYRGAVLPSLPGRTCKHCDLIRIEQPPNASSESPLMLVQTFVMPTHPYNRLPRGTYTLELQVVAANAEPVKQLLDVSYRGSWREDPNEMFGPGGQLHVEAHKARRELGSHLPDRLARAVERWRSLK